MRHPMLSLFYRPQPIVEQVTADSLVPAHPEPRREPQHLLGIILGARDNLIANWLAEHYRTGVDSFRIFGRQIVLANSPAAVKHVMATRNDIYERKSPQMRRALEVLLGDGLFISDGETWRRRRPLVADIVHKRRLPAFAPTMEGAAREMAERWRRFPAGQRIDMLVEMAELTAEIIARTVFGRNLGPLAAQAVIDGFTGATSSRPPPIVTPIINVHICTPVISTLNEVLARDPRLSRDNYATEKQGFRINR